MREDAAASARTRYEERIFRSFPPKTPDVQNSDRRLLGRRDAEPPHFTRRRERTWSLLERNQRRGKVAERLPPTA